MSTLHDRLVDLADSSLDSPGEGGPHTTGGDLWDRGIAVRRRQRIGTAAVLATAAVLLVMLGTVTWVRLPDRQSMPANAPAGIPDHLYDPSPWLPGTGDAGPLGPLAALLEAPRSSLLHDRGLQPVGVSATTGAYRFLDLPGLAPTSLVAEPWALAPDGRHVAYWIQGRVTGTSKREVTGVAVYDTATGEVRRHALVGAFGVRPVSLAWAGDETVVVSAYVNVDDRGTARTTPALVWDLSDAAPRTASFGAADFYPGGPGFVLTFGSHLATVDVRTGRTIRSFPKVVGFEGDPAASPLGDRVALAAGGRPPLSVSVLSAGADAAGATSVVRGSEGASSVLGWPDADHVALLTSLREHGDPLVATIRETVSVVDVTTGRSRVVTRVQDGAAVSFLLATDLLATPAVPAVEPPHPLSPRLVAGLGAGVVVAALLVLVGWRRRVRP